MNLWQELGTLSLQHICHIFIHDPECKKRNHCEQCLGSWRNVATVSPLQSGMGKARLSSWAGRGRREGSCWQNQKRSCSGYVGTSDDQSEAMDIFHQMSLTEAKAQTLKWLGSNERQSEAWRLQTRLTLPFSTQPPCPGHNIAHAFYPKIEREMGGASLNCFNGKQTSP